MPEQSKVPDRELSNLGEKIADPFYLEKSFPNLATVLTTPSKNFADVKGSATFVLDANCLLAAYEVHPNGLADIRNVFLRLKQSGRLVLPERALREFIKNRTRKLVAVYSKLAAISRPDIPTLDECGIRMFEDSVHYRNAQIAAEPMNAAINTYFSHVRQLREEAFISAGADPVSKLYAEIFTADTLINHKIDITDAKAAEVLNAEFKKRKAANIPPGFADKAKPDGGIGDYLIWLSILEFGKDGKDIVLVTDDRKDDWCLHYKDELRLPRFELVHEYRHSTGGNFTLVSFSKFLKEEGASSETVHDVRPKIHGGDRRPFSSWADNTLGALFNTCIYLDKFVELRTPSDRSELIQQQHIGIENAIGNTIATGMFFHNIIRNDPKIQKLLKLIFRDLKSFNDQIPKTLVGGGDLDYMAGVALRVHTAYDRLKYMILSRTPKATDEED